VAESVQAEIPSPLTSGRGYATSSTDLIGNCGPEAAGIPTASASGVGLTVNASHKVYSIDLDILFKNYFLNTHPYNPTSCSICSVNVTSTRHTRYVAELLSRVIQPLVLQLSEFVTCMYA